MDFDMEKVEVTEFGVGRDDGDGQTFVAVPVDAEVQTALGEMVAATWEAMRKKGEPNRYEPSEKHGSIEYLYMPLEDELGASLRELHEATNLPINANTVSDPAAIFCYFVRMIDEDGRHLTGLRRASQFKGVLKSRLISLVNDALKLVEDRVFKLDTDFDLLIDSQQIHILRPSGFEFAGKLQEAILDAVPTNVAAIQPELPFVDLAPIGEYAGRHPRAARYLASIRSQNWADNIDRPSLERLCEVTNVEVEESNGKITVTERHVMGFLEVLDRRRYEVELVRGEPERFKAASRSKIRA